MSEATATKKPAKKTATPHAEPSVWERICRVAREAGGRVWGDELDRIKAAADLAGSFEEKLAQAVEAAVAQERSRIADELETLGLETGSEAPLEIAEQLRRGEAVGGGPMATTAKIDTKAKAEREPAPPAE